MNYIQSFITNKIPSKADYPIVPKPEFIKTFNTQTNNFKLKVYVYVIFRNLYMHTKTKK